MSWDQYYKQDVTISGLLSNLYGQKEFLAEIVNSGARRVLEVGSGTGTMGMFLSWVGLEVTSIDINDQVVAKAKALAQDFKTPVTFRVADTFHLPFEDGAFDVVCHQGLLEHFSDQEIERMLDEQLRVASRVIASVPNHLYPTRDFGDERLMPKNAWEKIFKKYKVTKSYYYSKKFFPKLWVPRAKIQYLAVIEKR